MGSSSAVSRIAIRPTYGPSFQVLRKCWELIIALFEYYRLTSFPLLKRQFSSTNNLRTYLDKHDSADVQSSGEGDRVGQKDIK